MKGLRYLDTRKRVLIVSLTVITTINGMLLMIHPTHNILISNNETSTTTEITPTIQPPITTQPPTNLCPPPLTQLPTNLCPHNGPPLPPPGSPFHTEFVEFLKQELTRDPWIADLIYSCYDGRTLFAYSTRDRELFLH